MSKAKKTKQITSPEELDEILVVANPKGWLSLLTVFGLMTLAGIWSFFGTIPTEVDGTGMLIRTGGVVNIPFNASGRLEEIYVNTGDEIKKGQKVAKVSQENLESEIVDLKAEISEKKIQNKELSELRELQSNQLTKRLTTLKRRLASEEALFQKGLVIERTVINTQTEIDDAESELENLNIQALTDEQDLNTLIRDLKKEEDKLERDAYVKANQDGLVIEIKANMGEVVTPGNSLLSMELSSNDQKPLQAVAYVPAETGKRVEPGMTIHISPTIVNKQEFGMIKAKVTAVSKYPASFQGMLKVFQNESIVNQILLGGAPIAIEAELETDTLNPSGFKWTSGDGPPLQFQSGTFCEVEVTVEERKPIELLIPFLKGLFET